MPEPALLYTLDKKVGSITFNGNETCIGDDSLTIVDHKCHHTVRGMRPWVLPKGPVFCFPGMPYTGKLLKKTQDI